MKEKFIDFNAANLAAFSVLSYYANLGYQVKLTVHSACDLVEVILFTEYREIIQIPAFLYYSSLKSNDFGGKNSFSSLDFRFDYAD